ncbi:hypothetical protein BQ8420_09605 [Nocardiopsis sp. JB363]|nr:hypothetical protein BQ8420_09605 [Nocardiopsis sp. JB363]
MSASQRDHPGRTRGVIPLRFIRLLRLGALRHAFGLSPRPLVQRTPRPRPRSVVPESLHGSAEPTMIGPM